MFDGASPRLDVAGIAHATQPALGAGGIASGGKAFHVSQFDGAVQARLVVARVIRQAHRRGIRERADEVAAAQFSRVDLQFARSRFHEAFDHIRCFRPPGATIRIDGRGVREDRFHLGIDGWRLVLARQQRRIQDGRHAAGKRRQIRAHVGRRMHAHGEEIALRIERQFRMRDVVAAMRIGQEGFGALGRPLDRSADLFRCPRERHVFRVQEDLRAEPAAHIRRNHAHLGFGQAQHECRHQQAFDVRVLVGDVERVAVVLARIAGVDGARLDRIRDQPVIDDVELRHVRGFGKCRVGGRLVAVAPGVTGVVRHVVVDGGAGGIRSGGVHHGGQFVVFDVDHLDGVLGDLHRFSHHQRDLVAHVAHLALREHRVGRLLHRRAVDAVDEPAARQAVHLVGGQIVAREHGQHARMIACRIRIDVLDAGMRIRRAQECRIRLVRLDDVVRVLPGAGQEAEVFLALDGRADQLVVRFCGSVHGGVLASSVA